MVYHLIISKNVVLFRNAYRLLSHFTILDTHYSLYYGRGTNYIYYYFLYLFNMAYPKYTHLRVKISKLLGNNFTVQIF